MPPVALWSKVYSEDKTRKRLMRKVSTGILAMTKVSTAPLGAFVQALASHDLELLAEIAFGGSRLTPAKPLLFCFECARAHIPGIWHDIDGIFVARF